MRPEQLKWTDEQWAAHLGCAATDVPVLKNWLAKNYYAVIFRRKNSGKRYIEIGRRHDAPSGAVRFTPIVSTEPCVATLDEMVTKANQHVIPSLQLTRLSAALNMVPPKTLQMLHIENQIQR
ncbi:MAG: hypothetical protein IJ500_01220 [Alphaproteobacteria bacterium]|nr:hypothetical protein [Alphaproteobacteria bacterium]